MVKVDNRKEMGLYMAEDGFSFFKNEFAKSDKVRILTEQELRKLQMTELDMLKDFVKVCDKYELNYCLSGGSALGAIRHGGFIPWDDDVDVNMPRKDYNKLRKIYRNKYADKYTVCAPEITKGHGMTLVQIKKNGTLYRSFNEIAKTDAGIGIDIFVVENTPNNTILRKIHGGLCLVFGYMVTCRKNYNDYPVIKEYIGDNKALLKAVKKKVRIGKLISFMPLDKVTMMAYKVYSLCKNDDSNYVTIPSGRKHYFGEMSNREGLCNTKKMKFEDLEVNIPFGIEEYMNRLYGSNYMELPPEEKREKHPIMELDFGE